MKETGDKEKKKASAKDLIDVILSYLYFQNL